MNIKEIAVAVHQNARDKGWWKPYYAKEESIRELSPDQVLSKLMLVVSELSEACEEIRLPNCDPRRVYFVNSDPEATKVDFAKWEEHCHQMPKPEGFPIEIADAAIRILDLCEAMGVDLAAAIELKHQYNKSRPNRHGNKRA